MMEESIEIVIEKLLHANKDDVAKVISLLVFLTIYLYSSVCIHISGVISFICIHLLYFIFPF